MILVFSISKDATTQLVLEWLSSLCKPFVFIHESSKITDYHIDISEYGTTLSFKVNGQLIDIELVTGVWYRCDPLQFQNIIPKSLPLTFKKQFAKFISFEIKDFKCFFYQRLNTLSKINKRADGEINKLQVLEEATRLNIPIPDTTVFSHASVDRFADYIVKPISNGFGFFYNNQICRLFTQKYEKVDNNSFPTLIQRQIVKKYEVRSFYINGKFYSIALFSQQNNSTKIDYRNYDFSNPIRSVPFTLPKKLANKIHKLMQSLSLQSGSIDFICGIDNILYFIEVNPLGQFGNVSQYGNYYLEKNIATIISNEKRANQKKD
jgi:ATP-GRASP peptide maturase of grasp-with-spasm system